MIPTLIIFLIIYYHRTKIIEIHSPQDFSIVKEFEPPSSKALTPGPNDTQFIKVSDYS